ncbi:uncharacterized protein LOC129349527 [Amphiprion ocellaris]|uniref:uncharacterized protein LOC129349527 n=1 Tax=Amphiprion ocellaris TaxID=80972 RepID=UPI00241124F3|nr:uncharacterized protein LOC129349527 [Amphiprion ocellaris]XP_054868958.1 uncharacterized protein LOC129349527 [Amphiprion ocellaris]
MKRSRLFCLWWRTKEYRGSWTEKVYQEVSERMATHVYSRLYIKRTEAVWREAEKAQKMTIGPPRTTAAGVGQPGGVGRGLMEAIYWHRTGEQQEGDSAAALLETFEDESLSTCEACSTSVMEPPAPPPPLQHQLQHQYQLGHRPCQHQPPARHSNVLSLARGKGATENWTFQAYLWRCRLRRSGTGTQHDENIWSLLSEARENEAALQREEMVQNAAFNQSFLGVLGQLVQAVGSQRVHLPET